MTTLRLYFKGARAGPLLQRSIRQKADNVRSAARSAAADALVTILARARANIASAGNFGRRWTEGFKGEISEGGGNIRLAFTHDVPYFMVFQRGATIKGKPLLWIPLSFAEDAQGVMARDFPLPLFRVDRKGKVPLLFAFEPDSDEPAAPKYFGKRQVRIPKKFRVLEIIREVARTLKDTYRNKLRALNK
jgi:hypothetical protein